MKEIYIHIPKTGGSTLVRSKELNNIIKQPQRIHLDQNYIVGLESHAAKNKHSSQVGHCRWIDLDKKHREEYQAVAIVRNPWSKLVSQFLFAQVIYSDAIRAGKNPTDKPITDFNVFLNEYDKLVNSPYNWHRTTINFQQQTDYVIDTHGILQCNILRFEHYNEDTQKYFGLENPLPPRNVSNGTKNETTVINKKNYKDFYTEETKEIVKKWYAIDINFFGFTFDSGATKNIWNES